MNVLHTFRRTGRARGIQPERNLVGGRLDGRVQQRAGVEEIGKARVSLIDIGRLAIRLRDEDVRQAKPCEHRAQRGQQRCGNDDTFRATVGQDVADLVGRQQRVDGNRHDAGAQRAPERNREIDRVEHHQREPALAGDADAVQSGGEPRGRIVQARVVQRAPRIGKHRRAASAFADVAIDEIVDGVPAGADGRCRHLTLHVHPPGRPPFRRMEAQTALYCKFRCGRDP